MQVDLKDYLLDLISAYNATVQRNNLKQKNIEELFLKYLDKTAIDTIIANAFADENNNKQPYFPGDAIKTAKRYY